MSEENKQDRPEPPPPRSYEVTTWICDKHGIDSSGWVNFGGTDFCNKCIRDALLDLGIRPMEQRKETKWLST